MKIRTRSAGVVVVRHFDTGPRYLILRCYKSWDFPKGEVNPDEPPQAAALRELQEETGLVRPRFTWGNDYAETEPYGKGKVARYYVAECPHGLVTLPINPLLGRPEHHEFRWVSAQTARKLLPLRLHPILQWAEDQVHKMPSDGTPNVTVTNRLEPGAF